MPHDTLPRACARPAAARIEQARPPRALRAAAAALVLPFVLPLPAAGQIGPGGCDSYCVRDFLGQPDIFQLSVLIGAIAVFERWTVVNGHDDVACIDSRVSPQDVLPVLKSRIRADPGLVDRPFAEALIGAIGDLCSAELHGY